MAATVMDNFGAMTWTEDARGCLDGYADGNIPRRNTATLAARAAAAKRGSSTVEMRDVVEGALGAQDDEPEGTK